MRSNCLPQGRGIRNDKTLRTNASSSLELIPLASIRTSLSTGLP